MALAVAFVYAQIDIASKSIQFDLRKIGESVYEAHSKSGKWPAEIADLEGTEYLKMPHRRTMLDAGALVVVWQEDFDPNPAVNANRVLAYDNSSLLSRFGSVWVCRGDLRIERMSANAEPPSPVRMVDQAGEAGRLAVVVGRAREIRTMRRTSAATIRTCRAECQVNHHD